MSFFGLACMKAYFDKSPFLSGSVFQIILSCRDPQSLRSLCSFSLPSPLLFPSELCLCSQLDLSCETQLVKCHSVVNVPYATLVSIYFGCLQVLVSFASGTTTVLQLPFLLHSSLFFGTLCLLAFSVSALIFKPFFQGLNPVLHPGLMPAVNCGSHPNPAALGVLASLVYFILVRLIPR